MPTALTQILLGDGPVDEKGCLFINRADFPNAVPRQLTRPTTPPQLEYLIA